MSSSSLVKPFKELLELENSMRLTYGELLEKLSDDEVRDVITAIAADEELHKRLAEEALSILRQYGEAV